MLQRFCAGNYVVNDHKNLNKSNVTLRQPFGLWSAMLLVVANMIGAGVFTTSGFALSDLGDRQFVMYAWLVGTIVAVCGAISYGQLARHLTESGGEYLFLSRFVHPSIGFIAGWVSLLAGFTGAIAFAATALESYSIPDSVRPEWLPLNTIAIATIFLCAAVHSFYTRTGIVGQNWVVGLKLLLICLFVGFALLRLPSNWKGPQIATEPAAFSIFTFASTLVWISLSFSGFNAAVYITGEVDNPKQNVPKALLLGTLIVALLYLVLNFIFVYGPAPAAVSGRPNVAAVAASAIGGRGLATLIRWVVCVALLSSVSSMMITGPRVYAKMADDGLFPHLFNSNRFGSDVVPTAAIWLQAILASTVVYFSSLKSLLDYLGFTLSVSAACTVGCVFLIKRSDESTLHRAATCLVGAVYVIATLGLASVSALNRPEQLIGLVATVGSGLTLYFIFGRNSKNNATKSISS